MSGNLISEPQPPAKAILKDMVFYIVIVDKNNSDHAFLRHAINAVVPQAIVESVYEEEEAVRYFNNCSVIPHLIFINEDLLNVSGRNTVDLIRRVDSLSKVPIIFLTGSESPENDLMKQGADSFYSKPYQAQDLIDVVSGVNGKWLA